MASFLEISLESTGSSNDHLIKVDNFPKEPTIILFANKIEEDKEKWKVSIEEIETVVKEYNWDYFKISAKNGIGIDEGFNCIANKIYNKRIKDN